MTPSIHAIIYIFESFLNYVGAAAAGPAGRLVLLVAGAVSWRHITQQRLSHSGLARCRWRRRRRRDCRLWLPLVGLSALGSGSPAGGRQRVVAGRLGGQHAADTAGARPNQAYSLELETQALQSREKLLVYIFRSRNMSAVPASRNSAYCIVQNLSH